MSILDFALNFHTTMRLVDSQMSFETNFQIYSLLLLVQFFSGSADLSRLNKVQKGFKKKRELCLVRLLLSQINPCRIYWADHGKFYWHNRVGSTRRSWNCSNCHSSWKKCLPAYGVKRNYSFKVTPSGVTYLLTYLSTTDLSTQCIRKRQKIAEG